MAQGESTAVVLQPHQGEVLPLPLLNRAEPGLQRSHASLLRRQFIGLALPGIRLVTGILVYWLVYWTLNHKP
jgi:hypothetical protein